MGAEGQTINELFNAAVDRFRDSEFLRVKRNGEWQSLSYGDVARRVRELTLGLYSLGLRREDKIAIWSENRPEWNIADFAALALGAADVPIYTTQTRSQVDYILGDSGARAIFVSGAMIEDALAIKERRTSIEWVLTFDDAPQAGSNPGVVSARELINRGRVLYGERPDLYEGLWRRAAPEDLATLIYTSGTTGDPKGVMLTHRNLAANTINGYRWLDLEGRNDTALTYLPLSHIFERAVLYVYMQAGTVVAYAESVDAVGANLLEVKPTVMTSVPRMFEKIYARIVDKGISAGFPRKQIFLWSLDIAREYGQHKNRGEQIGSLLSIKHRIADALVFAKWRAAVGGRIRVFISGGAPLAPDLAYVFEGAGLTILQGYGLTETSPTISCNTEASNRIGTVGPVVDGVEVKIAGDGEILVKAATVMKGYYNRAEETEEAFTEDGWFRTGDIGYLDEDGFLIITDRKKELIKTSGGKYIAPQQVESLIKSSRFVSQVVVVGNNRKFASALIVPNMEMLRSYAERKGISYPDSHKLLENPRIVDLIQRQVDKYTEDLARFEKVKKVVLLESELTMESGELTPTLKPRRSVIEEKYGAVIDRLYKDEESVVAV